MTNRTDTLRLRRLVFVPAALLVVGITTSSDGGERRVHVQGGKMLTQMQNGKMVLKGIQGEVGGGKIQMAGNVASGSDSNSATVKFQDVRLAEAAEIVSQKELADWMGNLVVTGFIQGEWKGKGLGEITRTADGAMVIETGPGVISDEAALSQIEKITGISELAEMQYSSIKIQARATNGRIKIDFIRAEGPDFKLESKGTYDASTDNLNVQITATVSQELASKSSYMKLNNVMSFLRGEQKAESADFVNIPQLVVSGELRRPQVGVSQKAETAVASVAKPVAEQEPAISDSLKRASKFLVTQTATPAN